MTTASVHVHSLDPGETLVCPHDHQPERVTRTFPRAKGYYLIRTSRHDHVRLGRSLVEVVR